MEQKGINYEVKSRVTTVEMHLLFNGIEYTFRSTNDQNGLVTIYLTGVVLGKEYTFSFILDDMFLTDKIIIDTLTKFEKLYY